MLSSAASLTLPRAEIPQPRRRVPVREKNPNLFDLLLDETYPWETLDEEQKNRAVQILARLIVQAARLSAEKGKNDE
jgi:hypothetical protein